jgi:putative membrane protein
MILRWLIAAVHLLALGIGLGSVLARAAALRELPDPGALRRVFRADNLWALAAALWISTGIWRAFGGLEKGSAYYMGNPIFLAKIGMLFLILVLEAVPILTFIRWRAQVARGATVDTSRAPMLARISVIQAVLVVSMVFAATAMARGIGL